MTWTTFKLTTTTPVFNAGADQKAEASIRVPSLRGPMRFWFRALAGTVAGADLALLAAMETTIFGSANSASAVVLRLSGDLKATESAQHSRWLLYLMGQGLGDLQAGRTTRAFVAPGESTQLRMRFAHSRTSPAEVTAAIEYLAMASLWLTCAFGGVGSRARRGFGGIRIDDASGVPSSWDPAAHPLTPGLAFYHALSDLDVTSLLPDAYPHLAALASHVRPQWVSTPVVGRPAYPVLLKAWTSVGTSNRTWTTWRGVLESAGEELRYFRASGDAPEAAYRPRIKTPEWITTVTGTGSAFPLGALGLPVIFKEGRAVKVMKDREELRRPSPLWLRVVGQQGSFRLLSFALRAQFLPGHSGAQVEVHGGGRPRGVSVSDHDVDRLSDQWITTLGLGGTFIDRTYVRV
jgi:CRISPR type III-B/RAMP module RAMP protein Cmr1